MAVTIDEMQVEVQSTPPQVSAPEPHAEPKKEMSLKDALHLLHERKLRLQAD
jgi:hypothetical protein